MKLIRVKGFPKPEGFADLTDDESDDVFDAELDADIYITSYEMLELMNNLTRMSKKGKDVYWCVDPNDGENIMITNLTMEEYGDALVKIINKVKRKNK